MKIGILGGGQLARMLAQSAFQQGHEAHVFSLKSNDPAAQITRFWYKEDQKLKASSLKKFLKKIDVICFESEFSDTDLILKACRDLKIKIYPRLKIISNLQDRFLQKKQLKKYKFPTLDFFPVNSFSQAQEAFENLGSMVLKTRRFGYDGYGTFFIKNKKDLISVKKQILSSSHGFIAEKFCNFKKELALMVARNTKGQIVFLPTVETYQKDSKCLWVKGPIKNKSVEKLKFKIKKYLKSIDYVGLIAFELFINKDSQILINELAPRVHNSGHYSMNALSESQFDLHIKCITGFNIEAPLCFGKGFAMHNLIGSGCRSKTKFSQKSGFALHWYGKKENNEGRKMGHINLIDSTPDKALRRTKAFAKEFKI